MDSSEFNALVTWIKMGNYLTARSLFSQCKMIWPTQIPVRAHAVNSSNLRNTDRQMYQRLQIFVSVYSDALIGKLQFNDHY